MEAAGLVAGAAGLGPEVFDLGQEAGDLPGSGFGQLGGALGASLGPGQVDLGPGSHGRQLGGVGTTETFGDLLADGVELGGVGGPEPVKDLSGFVPGGGQLGTQLPDGTFGAGLGVSGRGNRGLGLLSGRLERGRNIPG